MALVLNQPISISDLVASIKITSFAVDITRSEIYVSYQELSSGNAVISEKSLIIREPDYTNSIADASASAGADVYAALKSSLYNQITLATGIAGTVA